MKLYIYEHCPFCIRPRMIAGIKNMPLDLIYLANDDEQAHLDLIGKKQVPFLHTAENAYLIESLEICKYFNQFNKQPILTESIITNNTLNIIINTLLSASKYLVYPRIVNHPENQYDFPTQGAKDYFTNKKEKNLGCFKANLRFPEEAIKNVRQALVTLDQFLINSFATGNQLSWDDIMLFPVLRNMDTIADLVSFPINVERYVNNLSELTKIKRYTLLA